VNYPLPLRASILRQLLIENQDFFEMMLEVRLATIKRRSRFPSSESRISGLRNICHFHCGSFNIAAISGVKVARLQWHEAQSNVHDGFHHASGNRALTNRARMRQSCGTRLRSIFHGSPWQPFSAG
jgi:hypothetical protein